MTARAVGKMRTLYAVFGDHQFQGLYRSRLAAERLVAELLAAPVAWHCVPRVVECNEESTFDEFAGYAGQPDARRAVYWAWFGRCKHNTKARVMA